MNSIDSTFLHQANIVRAVDMHAHGTRYGWWGGVRQDKWYQWYDLVARWRGHVSQEDSQRIYCGAKKQTPGATSKYEVLEIEKTLKTLRGEWGCGWGGLVEQGVTISKCYSGRPDATMNWDNKRGRRECARAVRITMTNHDESQWRVKIIVEACQ